VDKLSVFEPPGDPAGVNHRARVGEPRYRAGVGHCLY